MSSPDLQRDNLRGGLTMVLAMAFFAGEDAFLKGLTTVLPTGQLLFAVGMLSALCMAVMAKASGARIFDPKLLSRPVLLRTLGEITGGIGFILTLQLLPLSTGAALLQTMPLAITFGAALFLGEKVGWRRWTAVAVGFLGVLVILRPTGEGFEPLAAGAAMLTVFSLALRDLSTRRVQASVHSMAIAFWGMFAYGFSGWILMLIEGQNFVMPEKGPAISLGLAALLGLIGYYCMIVASRLGEVSAIIPYRYTRIIFALILGVLVFQETPDHYVLLGSAMIVGSGLYTFVRERYHAFHSKTK